MVNNAFSSDSQGFKSKEQKRQEAEARQEISKTRNLLQKRIEETESNLEKLAKRKTELEKLLADPETYNKPDSAAGLNKEYRENEGLTNVLEQEWEEYHVQLEELLERIKTNQG